MVTQLATAMQQLAADSRLLTMCHKAAALLRKPASACSRRCMDMHVCMPATHKHISNVHCLMATKQAVA
jgi:hypothetical protein